MSVTLHVQDTKGCLRKSACEDSTWHAEESSRKITSVPRLRDRSVNTVLSTPIPESGCVARSQSLV